MYRRFGKRLLDLTGASLGLVLFSPVLLIVAVAIWLTMGGPVLFRQRRPGQYGRPFSIIKFRTMKEAFDERGDPLPDSKRLTRLGKLLRSTSLDEFPALLNVLRGDMSLVGPRPLRMQYLERYTRQQARRHEVKPGITGWAQVNGRNSISWEQKFELDVWYVDHYSMWLDFWILLRTFACVAFRGGISADNHATMSEFMGSKPAGERS